MLARIGRPSFAVFSLAALALLAAPDRSWAQSDLDKSRCEVSIFDDCNDVFLSALGTTAATGALLYALNHDGNSARSPFEPTFVSSLEKIPEFPASRAGNGNGNKNGHKENKDCKGKHCEENGSQPPAATPVAPGTPSTTVTPEPATMALMGTGLLALGGWKRRRQQRQQNTE